MNERKYLRDIILYLLLSDYYQQIIKYSYLKRVVWRY